MKRPAKLLAGILSAAACAGVLTSCGGTATRDKARPVAAKDMSPAPVLIPALQGTVRSVAAVTSDQPVPVEGYAVVADLPNTGSTEMPPQVREVISDKLAKTGTGTFSSGTERLSADRVLSSRRTAAVTVRGLVPAFSPAGTPFDLSIAAIPNTQTTSLQQGLLWTCDLRIIGLAENGPSTAPIAEGRGPVYCNPFLSSPADSEQAAQNVRVGRVISGGTVEQDLPIVLQLYTPSYRVSGLVERVINQRFPHDPPYAKAQDDSIINLTLPDEYRRNPNRPRVRPKDPRDFVNLVNHMFLGQDFPGFTEQKLTQIVQALKDPAVSRSDKYEMSLCLEGLGRTVLPQIRELYADRDPAMRFYAARAGTALDDVEASVALEQLANTEGSIFQLEAVRWLANSGDSWHTVNVLTKLLNSPNTRVRVAAYEGLVAINSPSVRSRGVGRKYFVDQAPSDGPPLIYVKQTGMPRVALIGHDFSLAPETLWVSADDLLTVNVVPKDAQASATKNLDVVGRGAGPGEKPKPDPKNGSKPTDPVQIYYRGPTGQTPVRLSCSQSLAQVLETLGAIPDPRSPDYDPFQPYVGASYQRVVEMLASLCKEHGIVANTKDGPTEAIFESQSMPAGQSLLAQVADQTRPEKGKGVSSTTRPSLTPGAAPPEAPSPFDTRLPGEH